MHEVQELGGFLSFGSSVVRLGRTFLTALWDFETEFQSHTNSHYRIRIPSNLRLDLEWWHNLLPLHNGVLFFNDDIRQETHLYTDASSIGLGAFFFKFGGRALLIAPPSVIYEPDLSTLSSTTSFMAIQPVTYDSELRSPPSSTTFSWPSHVKSISQEQSYAVRVNQLTHSAEKTHINVLELRAIYYAFQRWATTWRHHRLVIFTDNTTAYHGIRNGSTKGPSNAPLRDILLLAAAMDITLHSSWIPTKANTLADALSRFEYKLIADICPHWQNPYRSPPFRPPSSNKSEPPQRILRDSSGTA